MQTRRNQGGVTGGGAGEKGWRGKSLWGGRGKGEVKLGSPGVIHVPDSQLLLTQNLQVKWENERKVTTDVLLCTPYIHFPYLVASHLHAWYTLSCCLLHGAQCQDEWEANWPRTSLYNRESSSVSLWASYLWDFTVCWICGSSLLFLFLSSIITVYQWWEKAKVVQTSGETPRCTAATHPW